MLTFACAANCRRENVRVLPGGETISVNDTHLGVRRPTLSNRCCMYVIAAPADDCVSAVRLLQHNLPDSSGNRYCINLVCVAAPVPE